MSTSPNYQRYSRCITVAVRLDNTDIGVPDSLYRKQRIRPAQSSDVSDDVRVY